MRKVSQDEFFAAIGKLDVEVSVRGRYHDENYGSDFRLKSNRALIGQTRNVGETPHYKPNTEYFLTAEATNG
jgi:hypothetical protein